MNKRLPIAILAGGMGTRISSITQQLPKAMVSIAGEPFIAHQLKLLAHHKFTDVVICVGYHSEPLIDFVKEGSAFGLMVTYVHDGEKLLGTGGAIKAAFPVLSENFFVMYGDSYLRCDYAAVQKTYENSKKLGLMTVYKNHDQFDSSNVEYDGKMICHYNKKNKTPAMHYIDYGLNVFSKKAFLSFADRSEFDLAEVQEYLASAHELSAYEAKERFYEIGSYDGIKALENKLLE